MTDNLLYDSIDANSIPSDATLMMGYINGRWQSYYQMVARFPLPATILSITVFAKDSHGSYIPADVLDVEQSDASPTDVPGWTQAMRALSRPIIAPYCSRLNTWPPTLQAFKDQSVPLPDFIVADLTGTPHLVPGSVATQYIDTGPYDISLTNGTWPLSTQPSPPPPLPPLPPITTIPVGDKMLSTVAVRTDKNGNGWLPTPLPWATFEAATLEGSDPSPDADNEYWPGNCKVQQRNGDILVSVVGCLPLSIQNVYVLTS